MKLQSFFLVLFLSITWFSYSQTCPVQLVNTSGTISDSEIYWAIIGQSPSGIWSYVNFTDGTLHELQETDNVIADPNGKPGPGGHTPGLYSNYFYKYTDHPQVNIPKMQGTRLFISVGSPLYLYAFSGTGGYAGINLSNPDDPNQGILYEVIEFTYDNYGYHGNTTRVDEFSFPISMQLEAANGYNRFVGEFVSYSNIINRFNSQMPAAFASCVKGEMLIAPGKGDFKTGGLQENYFNNYIDYLWSRYTNEDLVFKCDAGEFTGRVSGDVFTFYRTSDNAKAVIARKPTTIEILEGSGALAQNNGNPYSLDLVVQAQFCAAVNRHVVEESSWSNPLLYYKADPCNHYAKFWHQDSLCYGRLAYGFCYDDVFNQSTLLEAASPTKVTIRLGGGGTTDVSGGNSNGLSVKPNIGTGYAPCTGQDTTITSNKLEFAYSFVPNGNQVTVTLNCLTGKTGLVSVLQNKANGSVNEKVLAGSSVSNTYSGNKGDLLVITGKWMFAGGDAFTKDFIYEIGNTCETITTAIPNNNFEYDFKIYPNPAKNSLMLEGLKFNAVVTITNTLGQIVFSSYDLLLTTYYSIDVSQFLPGLYFVKIGNETRKVLIQK